ncbi:MAG: hypothetical protein RL563_755, partial [Pseudomonadota bacterium]
MTTLSPCYITKNRLGIYLLQVRTPKAVLDKNPHAKRLIQRSLGTRNRTDALRLARKMVVLMEENNFDLAVIDAKIENEERLFQTGRPLFEELNRLTQEGDPILL